MMYEAWKVWHLAAHSASLLPGGSRRQTRSHQVLCAIHWQMSILELQFIIIPFIFNIS